MTNETLQQQFSTLSDILLYKEQLRKEILSDEEKIVAEWQKLFAPRSDRARRTPSQRLSGMASTAVAIFDGALLSWKLYRKYRNGVALFKHRRR